MRHIHLTQPQCQAFGGAAGFQEFGQGNLHNAEPEVLQLPAELAADVVQDNHTVHVYCVASKAQGIRIANANSLIQRISLVNLGERFSVKGLWEVHHIPAKKRAEAGVKVIEARIDKPQRDNFDAPDVHEPLMCGLECAYSVSGPQSRTIPLK